jgi:hypothetical protein
MSYALQIGSALQQYAYDHGGAMPPAGTDVRGLVVPGYIKSDVGFNNPAGYQWIIADQPEPGGGRRVTRREDPEIERWYEILERRREELVMAMPWDIRRVACPAPPPACPASPLPCPAPPAACPEIPSACPALPLSCPEIPSACPVLPSACPEIPLPRPEFPLPCAKRPGNSGLTPELGRPPAAPRKRRITARAS